MSIIERIKALCSEKGTTMANLERDLNLSKGSISKWSKSSPNSDSLQKIADYFQTSVDFLLDREAKVKELNARDKRDIAKNLEEIIAQLENEQGVLAYGGEVTDSDRELYRVAVQGALEMVKLKNKEKYNPYKNKR